MRVSKNKMMTSVCLFLFAALFSARAEAGPGTSLGVMLGSPNGLTARHWLGETNSVDFSAGWALTGSRFQVNGNYLWTQLNAVRIGEENFDLFYGVGLSLRTKSGVQDGEVVFGPRLPIGLSYELTEPNIELFTQAALNVGVIPTSDLYLDANIGVRFYF